MDSVFTLKSFVMGKLHAETAQCTISRRFAVSIDTIT